MRKYLLASMAAAMIAWGGHASAELIYVGDVPLPGGVGNSNIILSLQANPNGPNGATVESGTATPQGCTGDTTTAVCKPPQNNTQFSFQDIGVTSASNFAIYLDAQESDQSITLTGLTFTVYNSDGTGPIFTANLDPTLIPLTLNAYPGQGNNPVSKFVLDAIEAAQLQAIFDPNLLIGLGGSFTNFGGGPERFFSATAGGTAVPEPASLALFGIGLMGLGALGRSRAGRRGMHATG